MSVFYGFLALCLFAGASANPRIRRDNGCPEIKTASNFNRAKYVGTWYDNGNYNDLIEYGLKCKQIQWDDLNNALGECIRYESAIVDGNKRRHGLKYHGVNPDKSKPERFTFTYPTEPQIPKWTLWILDTDYKTYSVEYICINGEKTAKVLTREQNPPQSVVLKARAVAEARGFKNVPYDVMNQTDCDSLTAGSNDRASVHLNLKVDV